MLKQEYLNLIKENKVEELKNKIRESVDVFGLEFFMDLLYCALEHNNTEVIDFLFEIEPILKTDIDRVHFAARLGNMELVDKFVNEGEYGKTAVIAAEYGHKHIVMALLDRGVRNFGSIAIGAAKGNNFDLVKDMLRIAKQSFRDTSTDVLNIIAIEAARRKEKEVLDIVLAMGVDAYHEIAYVAVENNDIHLVKDMISRGATNMVDVVAEAKRRGYTHIVDELAKMGHN